MKFINPHSLSYRYMEKPKGGLMMDNIKQILKEVYHSFFIVEQQDQQMEELLKAKKEWENAKLIFQDATNPEVIDYAIFQLDAAERKYMCLLQQIRHNQIKNTKEGEGNND